MQRDPDLSSQWLKYGNDFCGGFQDKKILDVGCDLDGKLMGRLNTASLGFTGARLEYVVLDYYNQIHITDSQYHCIHKLDKDLNYICSFGSKGDDDHQFAGAIRVVSAAVSEDGHMRVDFLASRLSGFLHQSSPTC